MADGGGRRLERERFEGLYREHFSRVAAYLLARADRDLAGDALARTFEVAWRRIGDVPEEPLPWLLGVARRVLAEQRRAQGRRDALVARIAGTVAEARGDHADVLIARERAVAALGSLSEVQREALLLVVWDGLSQREAAAALGCSRGAVAVRLHRARARLQSALREIAGEEDAATTADALHRIENPTRTPAIEETR